MSKKLLGLLLVTALSLSLGASQAHAQATWTGNCVAEGDVATIAGIGCVVGNLLRLIGPLVVLAAVFMIILAGAKIILGGENPKEYQSGMQTLLYAVLGILALGFIWFILVAIQQFTGAPVTQFNIGG